MTRPPCIWDDCDSPNEAQGLCPKHYQRWCRHGDVNRCDAPRGTPLERYEMQVNKQGLNGCWLWTGSDVSDLGYARFKVNYKRVLVHRWAYEQFVRPLLPGEVIDHLCDTPPCSNPDHLSPGTQRANVLRSATALPAVNARKTHCVRGHDLSGCYVNPTTGARKCRPCAALRMREASQRQ